LKVKYCDRDHKYNFTHTGTTRFIPLPSGIPIHMQVRRGNQFKFNPTRSKSIR